MRTIRSLLKKKEELLKQYFPNLPAPILRYFQAFSLSEIRLALISYYFSDVYELLDYLKGKKKMDADDEITINASPDVLVYKDGTLNLTISIPFPYFYRFQRTGKCVICQQPAINPSIDICLEHFSQYQTDETYYKFIKNKVEMFLKAIPFASPKQKPKLYLSQSALKYLPFILKSTIETRVWLITPYLDLIWIMHHICANSLIYLPIIYAEYLNLLPFKLPSPYIIWADEPIEYEGNGMIIISKPKRNLDGVKIHVK